MRVIAVLVLCLVLCDAIDIQSLQRRRRGSEKEIEVAVGGQTVKCPFSVDSGSLDKVVKVDDAPDLKATVKIGDATINIRECAMDDSDKGGFILNCGGSKTKWTAAPVSSKASDVTKSECDHVISALAAITQTYRYELSKANPISLPLATRQSMIDALPGVTIDAIRGAVSLVPATASDLQKQDQDLVDAVIALITQGQPTSNLAPWKLQLFFDKQKTLTVYEYDGKETTYKDTTKSDKQQLDHRVAIENAITNVPYERNGFASAYEKARRPIYTAQNFDAVANGAYPNYGDCAIHLKPSVLLRSILYTDNTLMYGTYLYLKANMKDKLKLPDPDKFDALMTSLKDLGGDQSVGTLRSWYVQQPEMKKKIGFVPSMLFDLKVADQLKLARTALLEYARTFPDDLVKKSKKQSDLGHHVPEVLVYGGVLARDIDKITCKKTDETKAFEKLAGVAKIQFSFI